MSARLIGQKQLNRRLDAIKDGRPILKTVQLKAVAEAKARVPRKTGHTARTISPGDSGPTFTIVQAAGAAPFLEFGTKPHDIRPRKASVLAWPAAGGARLSGRPKKGAAMRFARFVRHPGTRKQPFLVPAAVAAIKAVGLKPIIDAWNKAA